MRTITKIKDRKDIAESFFSKLRLAARGIFLTENGMIPLIFVSKDNYYKLPGGGVEEGEEEKRTLIREVKEDTGSNVKIRGEVGKIIEYRSKWKMKQISFCFWGEVISKGEPSFTEEELKDGFEIKWFTIKKALKLFKEVSVDDYHGKFVTERDFYFLREAEKLINKK